MFSKWRYVYELYKEKNFTDASKKLFISQPSLSAAIKNIEEKIGDRLFDRTGHGIELTDIGREYIKAAEQIMNIETDFNNKLSDIYNLESGSLVVGGANYISSYVLPKLIRKFRLLHPNVSIRITEANSSNLAKMLHNGEIDIIVDTFEDTQDLTRYPLCREKIFVCVPRNYEVNIDLEKYQIKPESIRDKNCDIDSVPKLSVDVFKNEPFILLKKENVMYIHAMEIFEQKNIEPDVVFSVDQLNISYALADSGVGLCFITDTFFKHTHYHENVVLYSLEEENDERMLYIAHKKNKYCSKSMREFIKIAKEMLGKAQ